MLSSMFIICQSLYALFSLFYLVLRMSHASNIWLVRVLIENQTSPEQPHGILMQETPFLVKPSFHRPGALAGGGRGGGLPRWGGQGWGWERGRCSCDTPRGSCYRRAPNSSRPKRFHIDDAPNAPNANNANKQNNTSYTTKENNSGKYNQ